ncbi:astacin-like metalloprotease toxin 5 [Ornithodoros turicata]|uniref:astacin-like metalloprotease toxin 5 n=1 Tax=Ornithodoros turicata TaxID=34597 RepID=UPI00313A182A
MHRQRTTVVLITLLPFLLPDLLQGDIMVRSASQLERFAIYTVVKDSSKVWPDAKVYYTIAPDFDEELDQPLIKEAMALVEEKTCVKFIQRTDEPDYVNIEHREGRCASYVGKEGGEQTLALDFFYCPGKGQIAHELMHALGFFHEHCRPDRDEHVDIMWDNIQDGGAQNFKLEAETVAETYGQPYDYESVMHYPFNTYSKDKTLATIVAKDAAIGKDKLGKGYLQDYLTEIDITKINKLYNCPPKT